MKKLLVFSVLALIGLNIGMAFNVANTEICAERWNDRVNAIEHVRGLNLEILKAHAYSESLIESVRMLALENGLLCERNKAAAEVAVQYEEESRRLKMSLAEACKRLEKQIQQINKLVDEVERLTWQVETLEKVLDEVTEENYEPEP
jgi:hypothetical protein